MSLSSLSIELDVNDVNKVWKELKARDMVYTKNQELCHELGIKEEKAAYMEQLLQNAKLELNYRNCLIEKVLKENEHLEGLLQNQTSNAESSSRITSVSLENHNLKRELELVQKTIKYLEDKSNSSQQRTKQLEIYIDGLKEDHDCNVNMMKKEIQEMEKCAADYESKLERSEACISTLKKQLTTLNEKHETVCKDLKDRTAKLSNLKVEYDSYKTKVEQIKVFVNKKSVEPTTAKCSRRSTNTCLKKRNTRISLKARDECSDEIPARAGSKINQENNTYTSEDFCRPGDTPTGQNPRKKTDCSTLGRARRSFGAGVRSMKSLSETKLSKNNCTEHEYNTTKRNTRGYGIRNRCRTLRSYRTALAEIRSGDPKNMDCDTSLTRSAATRKDPFRKTGADNIDDTQEYTCDIRSNHRSAFVRRSVRSNPPANAQESIKSRSKILEEMDDPFEAESIITARYEKKAIRRSLTRTCARVAKSDQISKVELRSRVNRFVD